MKSLSSFSCPFSIILLECYLKRVFLGLNGIEKRNKKQRVADSVGQQTERVEMIFWWLMYHSMLLWSVKGWMISIYCELNVLWSEQGHIQLVYNITQFFSHRVVSQFVCLFYSIVFRLVLLYKDQASFKLMKIKTIKTTMYIFL